jgi:hypothetical protein
LRDHRDAALDLGDKVSPQVGGAGELFLGEAAVVAQAAESLGE